MNKSKKSKKSKILLLTLAAAMLAFTPASSAYEGTIILCYHDMPKEVYLDNYGADQKSFIDTIEYFKMHGFTFISLDDLMNAKKGTKTLPEKTILLTFDDAYKSYYDFVYPVLAEYKIPSTLAVPSSWIENKKPEFVKHELMTWEEIREVANSKYVEVVSHAHDLHKGIIYNPQGNKLSAATNRKYDKEKGAYETRDEYIKRIYDDLKISKDLIEEKTGMTVRAIAWPYGHYNEDSTAQARKAGLDIQFTLNDKVTTENRFDQINRFLIHKNPTIQELLKDLKLVDDGYPKKRIVQVDLDMIHDPDPEQTERNLGAFLDRIKAMAVTTVYLQAFSDLDGDGNVSEVYFPNRILPVKQDLFNRVVHQLKSRTEVEVYAWMPMLSLDLPQELADDDLYVREYCDGTSTISTSWYKRLSPFSPKAKVILTKLYEDLAVHANIDGIIFQDDGYLNNKEDFHAMAEEEYKRITGRDDLVAPYMLSRDESEAWTQLKVDKLNELSMHLMETAARYRPEVKSARTLYVPVVMSKSAVEQFAQDYQKSLEIYDHVVLMAYPYHEEVKRPKKWLKELVTVVQMQPDGIVKTVFKVQTYDWAKKKWIKTKVLDDWLEVLVASGARHLAYYPDDYVKNNPDQSIIKTMMSVEDFPFVRDWK